jgi:hypothetical protein
VANDPQSPSHALVGTVLGQRWRLTKLLGEGGMGAVYQADGAAGERAIKVLHPEFAHDETILARFFAEAEANKVLVHQHIARIFEASRHDDGTPYLVMELLEGESLGAYMEKQRATLHDAVNWMGDALQALAVAHKQRIVHRDLKPDNLFLARDRGGRTVLKVLDFGIAKIMDAAGGMGAKTRTGVLLGTPGFMSPEQVRNSKAVDPRSDLWSVACILFELLTGGPPFSAPSEFAKLTAVLTEPPLSIAAIVPSLAHWAPFFARALEKEPEQRFQSAQEMAQAMFQTAGIQRGQVGVPTQAPGTLGGAARAPAGPSTLGGASYASTAVSQAAPQPVVMQPGYAPATGPSYVGHDGGAAAAGARAGLSSGGSGPSHHGAGAHLSSNPSVQAIPIMAEGPAPVIPPPPKRGAGSTHISGGRDLIPTPPPGPGGIDIPVVSAAPLHRGAPLWLVAAVGAACLVLGFVMGFFVGRR